MQFILVLLLLLFILLFMCIVTTNLPLPTAVLDMAPTTQETLHTYGLIITSIKIQTV